MWVESICSLIIGLAIINGLVSFLKIKKKEKVKLSQLFSGSYILIIIFGTISFILANHNYEKKHGEALSFIKYINGKTSKDFFKRMLVGLVSGLVFGIIDNAGLWFGMESLIPILPKGELTQAGYGNVFSDSLSAFLATFAGNIISNVTGVTGNIPIWAQAFGTFIGCLIGLFSCRAITGKI